LDSNNLAHPAPTDRWWLNDEEKDLLKAFQYSMHLSSHLEPSHPRDAFMMLMVSIECFFKYAYAVARFNAINDMTPLKRVLNFLRITRPSMQNFKCADFKHDVRKVISELRRRYRNLSHNDIQDFMIILPPDQTSNYSNLTSLAWMAFRYRDGADPNINAQASQYIADIKPKFQNVRASFFRGLP
jgi:hypothetical protein